MLLQRLTEALTEDVEPNSKYLSRLTKVVGFDESDPVVAISAGYMLWTALTQSGKVYVCGTGFDGYAGSLPETVRNGGWASAGQVRDRSQQSQIPDSMRAVTCQPAL